MNGLIEKFNPVRGYGFIKPLNGGNPKRLDDVFFHVSALVNSETVTEGAEVRFTIVRGKDGRSQAANIQIMQLGGRKPLINSFERTSCARKDRTISPLARLRIHQTGG